ncbi:hypothetical protein [Chondrinema litorale]|uniref:hypothetical protein n=1 Tax=Chondrinema litorale TaxID=2994555 RepID=UPI0025432594|nr:hypothetical protein [Chondrinema litorale]UZR98711.1 hypothetical protein OQ292_32395 [Chondrinema litorale]
MKTFSKSTIRNVIVFFTGPLFLIPAVMVGLLITSIIRKNYVDFFGFAYEGLVGAVGLSLLISAGCLLFAYPLTLIWGIPTIYILEKTNCLNVLNLILIGLSGATLLTLFIVLIFVTPLKFDYSFLWIWLVSIYCTTAVSLGCWFVYNRCEKI